MVMLEQDQDYLIIKQLIIYYGSQFSKESNNPNINYTNIGLDFMNELAMTRNFTLPRINSENYTKIGKIVNKYQLNQNNGNDNRKELTEVINLAILNSSMLPTTGNILNSNKKEYERRNNINNVKKMIDEVKQ